MASYPDNALVHTDYVYELAAPLVFGGDDVTDARAIMASVQHSFIKLPDNGYQPRLDDYRVGYFTDRVTDLTSRDPAPYRDVINRWNLVKKNPGSSHIGAGGTHYLVAGKYDAPRVSGNDYQGSA